jgi:hypothetical protein
MTKWDLAKNHAGMALRLDPRHEKSRRRLTAAEAGVQQEHARHEARRRRKQAARGATGNPGDADYQDMADSVRQTGETMSEEWAELQVAEAELQARHGRATADEVTLAKAAGRGDCTAVARLLAAGVNSDAATPRRLDVSGVVVQDTLLTTAVRGGHVEVAKVLLEGGAAPDPEANGTYSPLMEAVVKGSAVEMLRLLITHGAEIDATRRVDNPAINGHFNTSAFLLACTGDFPDIVELLVRAGCDIDKSHTLVMNGSVHGDQPTGRDMAAGRMDGAVAGLAVARLD